MKSTSGSCDPTSKVFVECGSLFLNVGDRSQAMLVAGGEQYGETNAEGICRFQSDGRALLGSAPPSFGDPGLMRPPSQANGFGMTAVSDPLGPGERIFKVECNQGSSADVVFSLTFSVLATGPQ